jgi:voltage-gated potassium channel
MAQEMNAGNPEQSQGAAYLHSASYDLFILVLTIFSLLVAVGLLLLPLSLATNTILLRVDLLICAVFFFDFFLSLQRAPDKLDYFVKRGGWLDLLGTIPAVPGVPWTVLFRLARLNRLVRIVQHLRGKDRDEMIASAREAPARTALLTIVILAILLITFSSIFILRFERGAAGAQITTGSVSFWWAFVTMTTVGYGDYVPITLPGRLLAIGLMTFGIGIFAVLTSFVASKLVRQQDDGEDIVALVREENAMVRAELTEIKALLLQQGEIDD